MADVCIANRASGQPRRRWFASIVLALGLWGCGPSPEETIAGEWRVDVDRWLAERSSTAGDGAARAALDPIARAMASTTRFEFTADRCIRRVGDRTWTHRCAVDRTTRSGEIVVRAIADDGGVHFVRIRPDERGLSLTWRGRTLPVIAVKTGSSRAAEPKMTERPHGGLDSPVSPQ